MESRGMFLKGYTTLKQLHHVKLYIYIYLFVFINSAKLECNIFGFCLAHCMNPTIAILSNMIYNLMCERNPAIQDVFNKAQESKL